MRRQIPRSWPLICGLWFAASMTLKVGVKVKNSAYISRAVTGSCPVICLMSASAICWPCSASVADINSAARVGSADLFQAYQRWAVRAGVKFTLTQKMLGQALEERGYRPGKAHGGVREWRGLGLRGHGGAWRRDRLTSLAESEVLLAVDQPT